MPKTNSIVWGICSREIHDAESLPAEITSREQHYHAINMVGMYGKIYDQVFNPNCAPLYYTTNDMATLLILNIYIF